MLTIEDIEEAQEAYYRLSETVDFLEDLEKSEPVHVQIINPHEDRASYYIPYKTFLKLLQGYVRSEKKRCEKLGVLVDELFDQPEKKEEK